jgi:hypothetical protein
MAKSKYSLGEGQIAKRIKEGRGSGSGADYSPWVRVDEVLSLGRSLQVTLTAPSASITYFPISNLLLSFCLITTLPLLTYVNNFL